MDDRCPMPCTPHDFASALPAYRRALRLVIALNLGMGLIEMAAGLLGTSQALKADALDFLGDGSITLLALVALRWHPRWRARAALVQGAFLGGLGLTVIGAALFRALVQKTPQAEVMGATGLAALLVNVASALILARYRTGDVSARAVWLLSRNDALNNVAVILAAALVYGTGTPWPDLVAGVGIAGLFLASAWTILHDALAELRAATSPGPP